MARLDPLAISRRCQGGARALCEERRGRRDAARQCCRRGTDGREVRPVWAEIDRLALPVLIHPGTPPGMKDMNLGEFGMVPPFGFMIDTTLAFSRIIFSGFLDKYPNVKLIAAHGGATLPYL